MFSTTIFVATVVISLSPGCLPQETRISRPFETTGYPHTHHRTTGYPHTHHRTTGYPHTHHWTTMVYEDIHHYEDKTYKLVSTDSNLDKVLKAVGIERMYREMFEKATIKLVLTTSANGEFTLSERSYFYSDDVTFQDGKPLDRITRDGRSVKTTFTVTGSVITETQKQTGKPDLVIVREFTPTHVFVKLQINDIFSFGVYDVV